MEKLTAIYNKEELAWETAEVVLKRDIYLMVTLNKPGKLVIRQRTQDGKFPRIPIKRHKDMRIFKLRIIVLPESVGIKIFTSTEPKEVKYAYI